MYYNEYFIGYNSLPKPLSVEETNELLKKLQMGDHSAADELAVHYIRLVIWEIKESFSTVDYDKSELVSVGIIGLMKAIMKFDLSKGNVFTSYALKCIHNEVLLFLKSLKKIPNISIDKPIDGDEGTTITIADTLSDDKDYYSVYEDEPIYKMINEVLDKLPERDREMTKLYFGFYDDEPYSQVKIAEMFSISSPVVSQIINRSIKKIGFELEQKGIIEIKSDVKRKRKIYSWTKVI